MAAVAVLAVVCLAAKVAWERSRGPVTRLGPITTFGRHEITPGELAFEAVEDSDGVRYFFHRTARPFRIRIGSPETLASGAWFAFVESRGRVWVFDGRDVLHLYAFAVPNGGTTHADSRAVPGLVRSAPEGVRALLPKAFKDSHRPVTPPA
jgi:hypothetical protein